MVAVSQIKAELQVKKPVKIPKKDIEEANKRHEEKVKAFNDFFKNKKEPEPDDYPTYSDGSPMELRYAYDTETKKYNWYFVKNREGDYYEMYRYPDYETIYWFADQMDYSRSEYGPVITGSAK